MYIYYAGASRLAGRDATHSEVRPALLRRGGRLAHCVLLHGAGMLPSYHPCEQTGLPSPCTRGRLTYCLPTAYCLLSTHCARTTYLRRTCCWLTISFHKGHISTLLLLLLTMAPTYYGPYLLRSRRRCQARRGATVEGGRAGPRRVEQWS